MNKADTSLLPHASFYVLFALSLKPRHGYELLRQIAQDADGRVRMGAGALYGTLKRLSADNLIEEMPFEGDPRRRYYRLTVKGWRHVHADAAHYQRIVQLAIDRNVIAT